MWAAMKKAVAGVTESTGIEIPGLPVDLGSLGDTVATVTQESPTRRSAPSTA